MTFEEWLRTLPEKMRNDLNRFPSFIMDKFREAFRAYEEAVRIYRLRK